MTQPSWGPPPPPRSGARSPQQPWPQQQWPGRPTPQWPPPQQWPAPRQPQWQIRPGQRGQQQAPRNQWPQQQWPPPPRRPRRSGLGNAVRIVMAIVMILMVASWVRGLMDQVQTPERTPAPPPRAPQQPADPNSPYQNEGYTPPPVDMNPPPVPGPRDMEAARFLVRENPLYDEAIPSPTNCRMQDLAVAQASPREKQEHFNELMGCLMTVWAAPVEAAGFQMPRPSVTVYTSTVRTRCGDSSDYNASYCAGDQRIYYADSLLDAFPRGVRGTRYAAEMILAHEFGHAVQSRTALLVSNAYLEEDARTESQAQESSRRLEVQADCFAGQFVRSVARSQELVDDDIAGLRTLTTNLGDDVITGRSGYSGGHGTGAARTSWFDRGLGSDAIAACNTFTATSDEVR